MTSGIELLHAVPGRARYKVKGLFRSDGLKTFLERRLPETPAILSASASFRTGYVLVSFNSGNTAQTIGLLIDSIAREYTANGGRPRSADLKEAHRIGASSEHRITLDEEGTPSRVPTRLQKRVASGEEQWGRPWHLMEADEVLGAFDSSRESGLSGEQVLEKFRKYGPNLLPENGSRSKFNIFIEQFKSLPVYLLGAAAGISILTGGLADAIVILSVVAINGAVGYVTESEAERTIDSLKQLVKPSAMVLRESRVQLVAAEELVPGDILVLRPGTSVAADGRLIEANLLSVDESVLTGESLPVTKVTSPVTDRNSPIADRANMVYMGTMVATGQGLAVLVATGRCTEVGCLQTLVGEAVAPETPMEKQLKKLGDQLVLISAAACGLVFLFGLLRGYGLLRMFKASISLAVAAVPEGLPAVATTTLALGIRNMRKHRVLIRQLEAVETLGCVQTVCFDKTGTITLNRMTVLRVFAGGKRIEIRDGRFHQGRNCIDPLCCEELLRLIQASVLCNETEVRVENGEYVLRGSPTENALIHMAIHASVDVFELKRKHPVLKMNGRSHNRLCMETLHGNCNGGTLIALKGNPGEILAMCDRQMKDGMEILLTDEDASGIELENERMAGNALRVLGVAYCTDRSEDEFGIENGFIWLGLVGMADPIRDGAKDLIGEFHKAGIDTVMLTGDQSSTAYAIGKELDLSSSEELRILDSSHLADIEPRSLRALSEKVHIFARVSPSHKLQIVQTLQDTGRVVAMTGDGINDGPALKAADIGIAMGTGGADAAREVADVILEADNLETLIIAVRDGRTIYNNIRKSLHFLLATNFSEIMVMLLTVAAGVGSPFNPMQLLWINLISDIFPGLALAMEEPESDVLNRQPRLRDEPIIRTSDFKRLTFEASTMSVSTIGVYGYGIMRYGVGNRAGTVAFQSLTLAQLAHAISCRSETHSIFSKEKLPSNKYLNAALGGSFALQMMTMFVPVFQGLLGVTPVGIIDGLVIVGGAALPLLINEATKKTASDFADLAENRERAAQSRQIEPVTSDALPMVWHPGLQSHECLTERI